MKVRMTFDVPGELRRAIAIRLRGSDEEPATRGELVDFLDQAGREAILTALFDYRQLCMTEPVGELFREPVD